MPSRSTTNWKVVVDQVSEKAVSPLCWLQEQMWENIVLSALSQHFQGQNECLLHDTHMSCPRKFKARCECVHTLAIPTHAWAHITLKRVVRNTWFIKLWRNLATSPSPLYPKYFQLLHFCHLQPCYKGWTHLISTICVETLTTNDWNNTNLSVMHGPWVLPKEWPPPIRATVSESPMCIRAKTSLR